MKSDTLLSVVMTQPPYHDFRQGHFTSVSDHGSQTQEHVPHYPGPYHGPSTLIWGGLVMAD